MIFEGTLPQLEFFFPNEKGDNKKEDNLTIAWGREGGADSV